MAESKAAALQQAVLANRFNPSGIQRAVVSHIEGLHNGEIEITDPTNPFVELMEAATTLTSAFLIDNAANNRKQYPSAAQTVEDLYLHMSDKDYIDRFASPASTTFTLVIDFIELQNKMVLDTTTGIRKVTIPRNSEFTISGHTFSLQFPIDIKQLTHDGFSVVYDTTQLSPLQTLTTNRVKYSFVIDSRSEREMMMLEIDADQFMVTTNQSDLNTINGLNKRYDFEDQFYFARVYYRSVNTNNQWTEIRTTHTDQVYDASIPTAVLKVVDQSLNVTIPQVYFTNGMISGAVRVDIYSTKGETNLVLSNFKPSAFEGRWRTIDPRDNTPEVAAFADINSVYVFSTKTVSGGKNSLTFEQLRNRVINNSMGGQQIPITNVQIQSSLENEGFEVVRNVDVVTNRAFLATRSLPRPFDEKLITAGATSIEALVVSLGEAVQHTNVRNNGLRITLTPEIVYENVNGIIQMIRAAELADILSKTPDERARIVNSRTFLYTPFHYVFDASNNNFDVRPYYLSHPRAVTTQFVQQNDTTLMHVNTNTFVVTKVPTGFRLTVQTTSNLAYRELDDSQVHVQLSYVPPNEDTRCFLQGTQVETTTNGERVFQFDITTNYDVNSADQITLQSFKMLTTADRNFLAALTNDFDLVYSTSALMGSAWSAHDIDNNLGRFLLPNRIAAITQEKVTIEMGVTLKNLWASHRSLPASAPYETWSADVPLTYTKEEYVRNLDGSAFTFDNNGQIQYNVLHRVGDPVLDTNGNQVYKHRAGDIQLDFSGQPIPTGPNFVTRQIDMFFIEGSYYFANDPASRLYRESIVATVVDWINVTLKKIAPNLLEQTKVFFYPKTTMGKVRVMTENSTITNIDAGQYLNVRLSVSRTIHENPKVREALTVKTIKILDQMLKNSTVAISSIITALKEVYGDDVIGLTVSGLGETRNLQVFTMMDADQRCSIGKRLTPLPNGSLIVQEGVTVDFVRHGD